MPWRRFILAVGCGAAATVPMAAGLGDALLGWVAVAVRDATHSQPLAVTTWTLLSVMPGLVLTAYIALRAAPPSPETRCRKCGYILRGITEPRCPECGERI